MAITSGLERFLGNLVLAFALTFSGCSYNLSQGERRAFSEVYYMSEEKQKDCRGDIEQYLSEFSANKEVYLKKAKEYPWMNRDNLTVKDKLYLVTSKKIRDAEEVNRKNKEMSQSPHRNLYPLIPTTSDANQEDDSGF